MVRDTAPDTRERAATDPGAPRPPAEMVHDAAPDTRERAATSLDAPPPSERISDRAPRTEYVTDDVHVELRSAPRSVSTPDAQETRAAPPSSAPSDPHADARAASPSFSAPATRAAALLATWQKKWPLAKPSATVGWAAACAFAVIVLALQFVWAARGELAARNPALKAMFSSVCALVGCRLPFPHNPELVKIEASDVRMVDVSRPQLVQLTATLRSYAGYYLAYPALDLVLTNANEHALARRVFVPRNTWAQIATRTPDFRRMRRSPSRWISIPATRTRRASGSICSPHLE